MNTDAKPLNTKETLDKISSLNCLGNLNVRLDNAEIFLRGDKTGSDMDYIDKSSLSSGINADGNVLADDVDIPAKVCIEVSQQDIKDFSQRYEKSSKDTDFYIDIEELGWNSEPEVYWGSGYFVYDMLHLYLYCTQAEFPVLQGIISSGLGKKASRPIIHCKVTHPDHMDSIDFGGHLSAKDSYRKDGWHQGAFCISGWNVSVEI